MGVNVVMTRSRAGRLASLILASSLAIAPGVAMGHDHRPPKTVLRHQGKPVQDGYLHQYCWVIEVEDDIATTECVDKVWDFPRRRLVDPGDRLVIRIRKPTRPTDFAVQAWPRRGDEFTGPAGDPESLPVTLRRRMVDGKIVAWNVVFTVDQEDRHYFIRAGGFWPDEQGAEANQDAFWLFHVRT